MSDLEALVVETTVAANPADERDMNLLRATPERLLTQAETARAKAQVDRMLAELARG